MTEATAIKVRLAKPDDYPLIKAIFESSLTSLHSVALPDGYRLTRDRLKKNSIDSSPSFWALECNGETYGFVYHTHLRRCKTLNMAAGLLPSSRSQGLGTAGVLKYMEMMFEHLPVARIEAGAPAGNIASNKTLLKLGLKLEGTLRDAVYVMGNQQDYNLYGILRHEFKI